MVERENQEKKRKAYGRLLQNASENIRDWGRANYIVKPAIIKQKRVNEK